MSRQAEAKALHIQSPCQEPATNCAPSMGTDTAFPLDTDCLHCLTSNYADLEALLVDATFTLFLLLPEPIAVNSTYSPPRHRLLYPRSTPSTSTGNPFSDHLPGPFVASDTSQVSFRFIPLAFVKMYSLPLPVRAVIQNQTVAFLRG